MTTHEAVFSRRSRINWLAKDGIHFVRRKHRKFRRSFGVQKLLHKSLNAFINEGSLISRKDFIFTKLFNPVIINLMINSVFFYYITSIRGIFWKQLGLNIILFSLYSISALISVLLAEFSLLVNRHLQLNDFKGHFPCQLRTFL